MISVVRDGEELVIARECTVNQFHTVNESSVTTEDTQLANIDGTSYLKNSADAVTPDVADWLRDEFMIDPEEHGVEVIDPESEEVQVI